MFSNKLVFKNIIIKISVSLLMISIISIFATPLYAQTTKQAVVISPSALSVTPPMVSQASVSNPVLDYSLDTNSQSIIVVEIGRGMRLYFKNPDLKVKIPAASKIMTAVIALEAIPIDTKITISKVAASEQDANILSLQNGEKYSLEYLLYGMLLKDNNAAAIAISEQISGVEEEFVKLMNSKAISYQMNTTVYTNATGALSDDQYTTVSDVARLVRFALTIAKFETIFKTKDIPFFLSTNQTKHLVNNLQSAWSFVDTTTGAFQSISSNQSSFIVTSSSNDINIITVASISNKNKILGDITTISNSIFSDYEFSTLVGENQPFPKSLAIGTDTISLKFSKTINYLHPRNVEFIYSTTYEENSSIEYPILTTKSVAKVTFELLDGTKITADLYPERDVWGESSYFQKIQSVYNSNRDIVMMVIISLTLLMLLCIYHLIMLVTKLIVFIHKGAKSKSFHSIPKQVIMVTDPHDNKYKKILNKSNYPIPEDQSSGDNANISGDDSNTSVTPR